MTFGRTRNSNRLVLALLSLPLALMLVFGSASASAQNLGACHQYSPPNCGGSQGGGNQGGDDPASELAGAVSPATAGGTGDAGGGNLPFTGYPLTPAVAIMLLLLALGVGLRAGLLLRDRLGARALSQRHS